MAVQQGMNVQAVQQSAQQLMQDHNELQDIYQTSTHTVGTMTNHWFGADASQYAQEWQSQGQLFQQAMDMIQKMSQTATKQAQEQAQASGH